jgi:hypothetical protein
MAGAPPEAAAVAAIIAPFLRFQHPPLHPDVYDLAMGPVPLLRVAPDDIFLAYARALPWTAVPPLPTIPTHFTCPYFEVEALFHGIFRMEEPLLLDSCPLLRYDLPSAFCALWDACVEQGDLDVSNPVHETTVLVADLSSAASRAGSDPRLTLTLAKTHALAPIPPGLPVGRRWMFSMLSRHFSESTTDPCRTEAYLFRIISPRFTHAERNAPNSRFSQMLESARLFMEQSSIMMAQTLALVAANIDNLGAPVARYWSSLTPPLMLAQYPGEGHILAYVNDCHMFAFGSSTETHRAFTNLLPTALVHCDSLQAEFDDGLFKSPAQIYTLMQRLADAYMETPCPIETDPSLISMIDRRIEVSAPSRMAAHIDPNTATARVQWHLSESLRVKAATKADLKAQASGTPFSCTSRTAGLNTVEFRATSTQVSTLVLVPHPESNAIIQAVIQGESRLIVLCLMGRVTPVAGYSVFTDLSPFKSGFPMYFGWSMSTDDSGVVPEGKEGRSVSDEASKLILLGAWAGAKLQLLNLFKAWEAMLRNAVFTGLPESAWFLQDQLLRCFRKFGLRLFSSLRCAGNGIGSFSWVVDVGQELLDMRNESGTNPADVEELVQWWFHSALKEAGEYYASQRRVDSNFAQPLLNVFLPTTALCLRMLPAKKSQHTQWDKFLTELPHTVAGIVSAQAAQSVSICGNTTASAQRSAVVTFLPAGSAPSGDYSLLLSELFLGSTLQCYGVHPLECVWLPIYIIYLI